MTTNEDSDTATRAHRTPASNLRSLSGLLLGVVMVGAALVWVGAAPAAAHTPHDVANAIALSPRFTQDRTAYTIVREYLLKSTDGGDTWKRLNRGLDNKHNLSAIQVDPTDPNLLYTASRGDGVYRSTDGGASWVKLDKGLGRGNRNILHLFVSPQPGRPVFAVTTEGAVFTTSPDGAGWQPVSGLSGQDVSSMAFAPSASGPVFAGADGAVLQSADGAKTWQKRSVGTTGHVNAIAVSPDFGKDRTLFVGTADSGVLQSTDAGRTFSAAGGGLSDKRILGLQISPRFASDSVLLASTWGDGVFRTDDAGRTWDRKAKGLSTNEQADSLKQPQYRTLVAAAAGGRAPATMFLAGFDGLFRSTDDGDSWQELITQDATNIGVIALSPDYAADGTIAVATYINGAFRSRDRGKTWTAINKGIAAEFDYLRREDYFNRLTTLAFSPTYPADKTLFAGSRGYFYDSEDDGATWHPVTPPGLVIPGQFPPGYFIPAFSPDFETDKTIFAASSTGLVFRSENGKTLKKIAEIGPEIVALVVSPNYTADRLLMAATVEGMYRSTDRGESWDLVPGTPKGLLSLSISSGFATDKTAFIGSKNGLLATRDGGLRWSLVTGLPFGERAYIESVVTSPDFENDGTALVSVRGRGLFRSTDGGKTFVAVGRDLLDANVVLSSFYHPTTEPIVFSPSFATDRTVYGMAESTIYRSTDAGETWSPLTLPRTIHPLTRQSAPNELLLVPRDADPVGKPTGGVTAASRARSSHTVLTLSGKRVAAAAAVALLGLALLWIVKLGSRSSPKRLAIYLRVACSGLIFAVALFFLTNR